MTATSVLVVGEQLRRDFVALRCLLSRPVDLDDKFLTTCLTKRRYGCLSAVKILQPEQRRPQTSQFLRFRR